jgi:hypothetical protein
MERRFGGYFAIRSRVLCRVAYARRVTPSRGQALKAFALLSTRSISTIRTLHLLGARTAVTRADAPVVERTGTEGRQIEMPLRAAGG